MGKFPHAPYTGNHIGGELSGRRLVALHRLVVGRSRAFNGGLGRDKGVVLVVDGLLGAGVHFIIDRRVQRIHCVIQIAVGVVLGGGVSCRVVPDFQRDPGVLQGLCRGVFQVADLLDEVGRRVHLGAKIGLDTVVVLVDGGVELRCIVVVPFQLCPADAKHRHERQRDEHDRCRAALFGRGGQF